MGETPVSPISSGLPAEKTKTGNGRIISLEAAIALIVALINLALDQADIHIVAVSWISIAACIVLAVDILRRTKWTAHAVQRRKRLVVGSCVIALAFIAFGVFLSVHKKAVASGTAEQARSVSPGRPPGSLQPEPPRVEPANSDLPIPPKAASPDKSAPKKRAVKREVEDSTAKTTAGSAASGTNTGSVGTIIQGPCSVAQIGGTGNQATGGNCGPPAPKVTWRAVSAGPNNPAGATFIYVSVDRTWDTPGFVAECSHPCKTGEVAFPTFGGGRFIKFSLGHAGDKIGVALLQSLAAGQEISWYVAPLKEGDFISVKSVSMMAEHDIENVRNGISK